jgi:predicted ribonuclease toxin of YeeF-YezG toxin-antitoxin module
MRRQKVSPKEVSEAVRHAKDTIKELEKTDPERARLLEALEKGVEEEVEQTNRLIKDPDRKRSVIPSKPC